MMTHRRNAVTALLRSALSAAVLSTLVLSTIADEPTAGRKFAFLVGVEKYKHGKLPDLDFPENDVEDLDAVFRADGYKTLLLTTKLGKFERARRPTQENIWKSLNAFLKDNKPSKADLMFVCLAGHGIQPLGSDDSYFCPLDANPTIKQVKVPQGMKNVAASPETLISIADILKTLDDSGVGYKLLLVDACRNDPSVRGRRGVDHVSVSALPEQTGVLLSCKAGEFSFEHKSLGRGHGAFFHHVIEGIKGAAKDEDSDVTWNSLSTYVQKRVPAKVRELFGADGGVQSPNAINNLAGEPAVLARITPNTPTLPTPTRTPEPPKIAVPGLLEAPFDEQEARAARKAWSRHQQISEELKNSLNMEFVLIPAGRFAMGSTETSDDLMKAFPSAKPEWFAGERPVHRVSISRPFYLGKYEITKGQFKKFVEDTGYRTDAEKDGKGGIGYTGDAASPFVQNSNLTWRDWGVDQSDESPVVNVSYNDAVAYCNWLSKQEGKKYRLPTEAEWEYACRAGTFTRHYLGDDPDDLTKLGNIADAAAKAKLPNLTTVNASDGWIFTSRVGQFRPNNFGLYDMIGNAYEWCSDWYDEDYYSKSPDHDPSGPPSGSHRVYRGGSWAAGAVACRAAGRNVSSPQDRHFSLGFRVVISPEQ